MEQLINFIIRPPRAEYEPNNDLLDQEFMLKGKWFQRKDIEIVNSRGDTLQCSHYLPIVSPEGKPLPCVIYCHGNSGCRADASEAAIILLSSNITVFTLDFSGSGLSGGEHVSLGWYEKEDLKSVVDYLRADGNVSLIGLWGRSMGAVTSLMYGAEDPSIAGMVLDSPFSDLVDLMMELVDTYKIRLPKFTVKFAIQYMKRAILKKAKFDISELNTIKSAKSSFVPVLFGHAVDDDFIHPHHSDRIYEAYVGDKNIIKFEGDHNSPRPQFYFDSINIFFHNVLQPPEDEVKGNFFDSSLDYLSRDIHGVGYEDDFLITPQASSSTEDAINQLRSKRPMSKTEVPSDINSTDKQCNSEDEGATTDPTPSSSKMINFEFPNGHTYVPSPSDDQDYVEYPLQHVEGFPCNVEEEERMLMEAVLLSLKDLEPKQPKEEEQPVSDSKSPVTDHIAPIKTDTATPASTASSSESPSQFMSPCNSTSSAEQSSSMTPSVVSSSDADMADRTKATVTVVKTPSSNIMDGLLRRWDLNFFKNR
ncbi:alpha/beta-Hydrolases superfamily protein [Artemisia annua]|uniref:Alpha/beta-Hydrolases superfamily protein n=1 Tax=Artemisia annua TaxID=35608 RepID=A0A2U1N7S1_ARTAN|nr:alpha/beta-Hydrolases superfamily protein [Artemisia annua]